MSAGSRSSRPSSRTSSRRRRSSRGSRSPRATFPAGCAQRAGMASPPATSPTSRSTPPGTSLSSPLACLRTLLTPSFSPRCSHMVPFDQPDASLVCHLLANMVSDLLTRSSPGPHLSLARGRPACAQHQPRRHDLQWSLSGWRVCATDPYRSPTSWSSRCGFVYNSIYVGHTWNDRNMTPAVVLSLQICGRMTRCQHDELCKALWQQLAG